MTIERAAVIGAGVMGGAIAAHIANAGVPVVLLDVVPGFAAGAVDRMQRTDPAPFMHPKNARLVTPGDLDRDLGLLAEADWIVEAVVEDPAVKRDLFRRIDPVRKPGSIVSSNTSTIPLGVLLDGQSAAFRRDFLITHFFNPPRYMRLLELVEGPETRADALAAVADFADRRLGKGVVRAKDTPGFIANRIGAWWITSAVNAAFDLGLSVEEADAVMGRPFGFPKTGIFGLLDLVGLDLMPKINASLLATLPPDDPYRALVREQPLIARLVAEGYTGRKGRGGFYRLTTGDGGRVKEAVDLKTGAWRRSEKARPEALEAAGKDPAALLAHPDRIGAYARRVMAGTLAYAASLVPAIAEGVAAVDEAMRLGYNWRHGPFELIDRIGADRFKTLLEAEGVPVPPLVDLAQGRSFYRVEGGRLLHLTTGGAYAPVERPDGVLLLADVKRAGGPVWKNGSAALWDVGDGVLCLEFTSKMNALDADSMAAVHEAIRRVGDGQGVGQGVGERAWKALVIHNEGDNFSVGANLGLALFAINVALWPQIEELVALGQSTYRALKYAPFPVVAAPSGMALGGGCEILMHCDAVQAHAETYAGLVEVGVGIIPAWGGTTALLARLAADPKRPRGPMPAATAAFETISLAKVAKSAAEARDLLYLRPGDGITMNRDRLLADAKARALDLARDYRPPEPPVFHVAGPSGRVALDMAVEGFRLQGKATAHDVTVCRALAGALTGGAADPTEPLTEEAMHALERAAFMTLVRTPATIDRIEHMLATGKPLRN